jgi:hypothetical protein
MSMVKSMVMSKSERLENPAKNVSSRSTPTPIESEVNMSIAKDRIGESESANVEALPFPNQEPAAEKMVASKFILTDSEGKERASLFIQDDMAMLALCDKEEEARLLLAVTPEGFVLISAMHRLDNGQLDDSFRLVVSNGEPEITLRDAIFKDCTVISPRGLFSPAST